MKKITAAILCLILSLAVLAGCGQKAPVGSGNTEVQSLRKELSGTWNQVVEDGSVSLPEMGIPSGYIFYLDGTGIDLFWDMSFTYEADGKKIHIAYDDSIGEDWDYSYQIEKDRLTMTRMDDDAITMVYQREPEPTEPSSATP